MFLDASELEQIARCPYSINHLETINKSRECLRCKAFSETGRFVLQRNFRGGHLPTPYGINCHFQKISKQLGIPQESVSSRDRMLLHDLLIWGKGISDNINMIGQAAETHFGLVTIKDIIDAVIYDIDNFAIVQFVCDKPHNERIMNYRALHASLWLRENYGVNINSLMLVKMSEEGVKVHRYPIETSVYLLRSSIEHILSNIQIADNDENKYNKLNNLPVIFGEHCWHCMACFNKNGDSICPDLKKYNK